jgi:hypothetical protein
MSPATRPANTSRTRIRVAVRNIAEAAVAADLTTRVVDVMVVDAMAAETAVRDVPITRRTCRAAMPRVPPLLSVQIVRVQMLRAATPSPVLARMVAAITVVAASAVAVTVVSALAAAVAVDAAAVMVELVVAGVAAVAAASRAARARVVAAVAVAPAAEAIPVAAAASRALPDSGLIRA